MKDRKNYEVTIAFDASIEDKQFFILKTVFFDANIKQLLNNVDYILQEYIGYTGSKLDYIEVINFDSREKIELPEKYPRSVTKGVIKGYERHSKIYK